MKKTIRKTSAALICGAMLACTASCGNMTGTALTVDGKDIRAGIYIYYQMQALSEASGKLKEEQPDLDQNAADFDILKYSVENTPVSEWVKNKAIEYCREFTATEEMFDEYGLNISSAEMSDIKQNVNSLWTEENSYAQYFYGVNIVGEYYEKYGIGKQSYQDTYTLSYKKDAIFNYLYGEGGVQAVPESEIDAAIKENYALAKYFEADPEIGAAQEYADSLNNGVAFADVKHNYDTAKEYAEVTKAMEEAIANGEEYDGTLPDEIVVDKQEEDDLLRVISKTSTSPSEDFVKAVFEMSAGENKVITVSVESTDSDGNKTTVEKHYVVSRLDITSDEKTMTNYRSTQLHSLKDEELKKAISDKAAALGVSENAAAINKYKAENLAKR